MTSGDSSASQANPMAAMMHPMMMPPPEAPAIAPGLMAMMAGNAQKAQAKAEQPKSRTRLGEKLLNDPDICELFEHFQIHDKHKMRFCRSMERRQEAGTFTGDMLKMWELCEQARNPEAMLVSKFHELEQGTFVGMVVPDQELLDLQKKYGLDQEAISKLTDVLAKHAPERRAEYMIELEEHLARSSKPSAMVMMSMKKIAENQSLGKPGKVAPGSYLARQEADGRRG